MSVSKPANDFEQLGNQETAEYQIGSTERKIYRLEEELSTVKAELEQYRLLYENLPIPYFTLDPTGKILAVNFPGAAHLKYAASELIGKPIFSFFCLEDRSTLRSTIVQALQYPQQAIDFSARQIRQGGQIGWVKATMKATQNAHCETIVLLTCEDVTAAKQREIQYQQAEAENHSLRVSEQRLRLMVEHASEQIFTCDRSGELLCLNHVMSGFTVEQVIGTSIDDYILPDHHSPLKAALQQVFQTGKTVDFQTTSVGVNGSIAWYASRVEPIWRDDQVVEAVIVCTEITERQQTEEALRQSQQQLETITANIPGVAYRAVYHADGRVSLPYVSQGSCTLYGFEVHEITAFSTEQILAVFHPDDLPKVAAAIEERKRSLEPGSFEYRILTRLGEMKWIRDTARFQWNEQGDFIVDGIGIDITVLKQAEATVKESERQMRTLIANIPGAVYRCAHTQEWNGMFISDTIEAIVGYPACDFSANGSRTFASIIYPDDQDFVEQIVDVAVRERQPFSLEYRLIHADGSVRWIDERGQGVFDAEGQLLYLDGVILDISDRKRIEQERKQVENSLRANEERFRQLAENIQEVFWMVDVDDGHQMLYVSPAYEKIWQRSRENLYQQSTDWANAIHPEDYDRVMVGLKMMIQGNYDIEYRIVRPDGSIAWIRDRAFPIQAQDGQVYRVAGIAEDITEHKRTENRLHQQAERERLLGDIAQRIRQSLDLDEILNTTVTEVRQVLQADRTVIFRFQPDWSGVVAVESVANPWTAILGSKLHDLCFTEADIEQYQQGYIQIVENIFTADLETNHLELLIQLQVKANLIVPILQGDRLWGLLIAHQCHDFRQWQSYEVDLLKQLATRLEIAIHQSQLFQQVQSLNEALEQQVQKRTAELRKAFNVEALLRRITDKVRDSLEESHILQTAVQELAIELQTYSCDTGVYNLVQAHSVIRYEYVHSNIGISSSVGTIVPFSVYPEVYSQLLQGHYLQFCWLPTFDDPARLTEGPFTMLACPIMDDQKVIGDLWLYRAKEDLFEDVEIRLIQQVANYCAIALRQSRLYQSAQAQVEELEQLNRLKDDFLSTVSHELRTPVANIKMATQMLEIHLERLGILDDAANSVTRYLHVLKEECQREIGLINDLLDLTRIESGTEPLVWSAIDLSTWLPHIAEPFFERTQTQSQQLSIDISSEPLVLTTDISYLERILRELLQNACKYTPANETIQVTATAQATDVEICVSNTGIEIPEDELMRIFDKFYRIPNNDPWKHGGTGLGLALVKRLVSCLNGTISVSSEAGCTAFTLQFPQPHVITPSS